MTGHFSSIHCCFQPVHTVPSTWNTSPHPTLPTTTPLPLQNLFKSPVKPFPRAHGNLLQHLTSQTSGGKFSVYFPTIISGLQALTQHSPPQFLSSPTLSTVLPHTQKLLHEYLLNWIVRPILYILVNFSNFVPVWKIEKKNWPCHQVWALTLPLTICATQQAT